MSIGNIVQTQLTKKQYVTALEINSSYKKKVYTIWNENINEHHHCKENNLSDMTVRVSIYAKSMS